MADAARPDVSDADRHDSATALNAPNAIVLEQDQIAAAALRDALVAAGLRPLLATDQARFEASLGTGAFVLAVLDAGSVGRDPVARANALRLAASAARIVIGTDLAVREAVEWMRLGADDVLVKPIEPDEIADAVRRALERRALERRPRAAMRDGALPRLVGGDARLEQARAAALAAARVRSTVLLEGESGTGKSLLARAIHEASPRAAGPFVEVACGSLSETLLESELFGHVRGAFTGALADKKGRFLAAHGGTIFLDEINSAPPAMQVKLLRVLQERRFEPVGGDQTLEVDVRVIAATNHPLEALVAEGRFRQDLFYRVRVMPIALPPLRDRSGDVLELAHGFLEALSAEAGRTFVGFTSRALDALAAYRWPGNVRELENAIERATILAAGPRIDLDDLPPEVARPAEPGREEAAPSPPERVRAAVDDAPIRLSDAMRAPERALLLEALERTGWNRSKAAVALGINRATLYRKMRELGLGAARDAS